MSLIEANKTTITVIMIMSGSVNAAGIWLKCTFSYHKSVYLVERHVEVNVDMYILHMDQSLWYILKHGPNWLNNVHHWEYILSQ